MEYLSLEHVSKSYGEKILFENLNFTISRGEKIALIARNGSGKSSLLRIIAGIDLPEGTGAKVLLNKKIKTGYLSQEPSFNEISTVSEVFFNEDIPELQIVKKYNEAILTEDHQKIQESIELMDKFDAWNVEARGKEVLFKLNLKDLDQPISTLSGGQKKRLALALIIMREPDFLILDEPTNHLDIEMIEWLEKFLSSPRLTLFMVTHDRYFLERICNQIVELDGGNLFHYSGNYSDYLEKKLIRSHQERTTISKAKKLYLKELEWIRRQPKARGTKARSRVTDFNKLKEKISGISYEDVFEIDIDSTRLGKKILEFYDAEKSFDDHVILRGFWYKFKKGERVGICGPNGSGKSSFARILIGSLPLDKGKRVEGETVKFGFYTQEGLSLAEDKRVIDVIRDIAEYIPLKKGHKLTAASLLEKFLFDRDQQKVYISQLSGGEKKRLHLLEVLMSNPNFLILDEPTNDLDVITLNVLEEYLMKFDGCVVVISHDRYFMDKLVDHVLIFHGQGNIKDFNGTYSEWRKTNSFSPPQIRDQSLDPKKSASEKNKLNKRRLSYHEKKEMQSLENRLKSLEDRKAEIEKLFVAENVELESIDTLSKELGTINSEIDQCETRWLELSEFL